MTRRHTKTRAPFTAAQMYDLVADVEKYPQFIPYCVGLRVVSAELNEMGGALTADMLVAYKVFREKFRSRVELDRPQLKIDVEYIDGPFHHLTNHWAFIDLPSDDQTGEPAGCEIDFEIDFEFRNFMMQAAAGAVFERAFEKMSDAFVARAYDVYQPISA